MTSVLLCCLIAPWSRRSLFIGIQTQQHVTVMQLFRPFPCEKRSVYIQRLSRATETAGNANTSQEIHETATCLPRGLFWFCSPYQVIQPVNRPKTRQVLSFYAVTSSLWCTGYAVPLSFQPLKLIYFTKTHVITVFHIFSISSQSLTRLFLILRVDLHILTLHQLFICKKETAKLMLIQKIKRAPPWLNLHRLYI